MINKFPIKVETYPNGPPHRFIEWKLHDKCNYDCSFCGAENKIGIRGWFDIEKNKAIVDRIADTCNGSPYWIQLTGGEPTLYPKLIELLLYMKQKGAYVSMISNGSRTLRWWKMLRDAKVLDFLYITYHSQQKADYKHIVEVLNLFHYESVFTIAVATYTKDTIALSLEGIDYIAEHTGSWITMNAMDLLDYYIDSETITEEQFDKVKQFNGFPGKLGSTKVWSTVPKEYLGLKDSSTIHYSDGSSEDKNTVLLMKLNENRFEGWDCEAGLHSIKIEDDFIYRGGCKRDPIPFSLDNIKFYDKSFKCDVLDCFCYTDMVSTKTKTDV